MSARVFLLCRDDGGNKELISIWRKGERAHAEARRLDALLGEDSDAEHFVMAHALS